MPHSRSVPRSILLSGMRWTPVGSTLAQHMLLTAFDCLFKAGFRQHSMVTLRHYREPKSMQQQLANLARMR